MDRPANTGFGRMLIAIFCPPLYFFLRGKVLAGVVHSVLYIFALLTLIFGVGFFFWFAGVVHAYWDLAHVKQEQMIQRQAAVIAEKLGDRRREEPL